jgi:transposase
MRAIGLDVHLDFCEVAIAEGGELRSAGRIATRPEEVELFAQSLGPDDRVALEVTGNAWEIKRLIEPHVAEVIVVSPGDTGSASRSTPPCVRSSSSTPRSRRSSG